MIIVGIIAVVAVGRLDFTSLFEQRGVQDRIKAALQFGRKAAVAQRRYVCVCVGTLSSSTCTAAGDRVSLSVDTRAPETAGATYCDVSSSANKTNLTLAGIDRHCTDGATNAVCSTSKATIAAPSAGNYAFAFDPQGRRTTAGSFVVSVTGQSGVTVEVGTGYVH